MKVIKMNNREFKFRVWNGTYFISDFYISNDNVYEDVHGEGDNIHEYHLYPIRNVIVQQYTGLKDKNNNDIFEGDIVKLIFNGSSVNGLVHYAHGQYLISFNGFYFNNLLMDSNNCEVLGNMFENSELLYEKI